MTLLMDVNAVVSLVNVALLSILLAVYFRLYRNTKATFSLGLLFFAGMLAVQNIISVYAYFAMAPLYAESLLPYFLGVHVAELAGISALLRVTI